MFPIKYIENNMILNQQGEWWAYYELIPYNYAFLSPDEKMAVHERFRQIMTVNREGKMHALCIASETSVRDRQERCKRHLKGDLKETAEKVIDIQTEGLITSMGGIENEVTYRFFLGFKLIKGEEEVSVKKVKEDILAVFTDFINSVNHNLMGDFVSINSAEIERYAKLEDFLRQRVKGKFSLKRLEKKDIGYIVEHIYGQQKTPYYKYEYSFPKEKLEKKTLVRKYDILRLTRCVLQEHQKHIRMIREEGESYVAYLTINALIGELEFPSSEIFYYEQERFRFPVDVSMNVEIMPNRSALTTVRNKKKELNDLDEHAYEAGADTDNSVVEALVDVDELEKDLGRTKESMYKLSYVVRIAAESEEELERRIAEVRDYYENDFNIKLVRPFGDMIGFHEEFIPSGSRYENDYIQYVKADFLAGLGFGAARILGDPDGSYIGYDTETGNNIYIDPSLACQNVEAGADTDNSVVEALVDVDELEKDLGRTKESMYKLSYVVRIAAESEEELERRIAEVRDYYENDFNIKLVRPFGDMIGFHEEFIPSGSRYENDYIQYVKADFLAGLGFGAARILGDPDGSYIGYDTETGNNIYIDPSLACQNVVGSVTNALAVAFTGTLGGGKSMSANNIIYQEVLHGARALILDPKSERGKWKEMLPELSDEINIINLTSDEGNKGMLDPYVIMQNKKDADSLAMDILTFLTGVSIKDGKRFPLLRDAVKAVTKRSDSGLLYVIDELNEMEDEEAHLLASHIAAFTDYDFAGLLFSDGKVTRKISADKALNILQVQDLMLPDSEKNVEEYTSIEYLSIAVMITIGTFALDFIYSDRKIYKIVALDEAWSLLQVAQGAALSNKLVRAGRSMQSGVFFITQSSSDLLDEKIKNNIGLKFAFHSTDKTEIRNTLRFFGLDPDDEENQNAIMALETGECLMQDIYGRVGKVHTQILLQHVFDAFDTRPPRREEVS